MVSTCCYIAHDICSDGGAGGEKVLYQAVQAIQMSQYSDLQIVIYSGSDKKPKDILEHVRTRFGLNISPLRLSFVRLESGGKSLKPDNYPSFTMLWQALASIAVAFEALMTCPCDIFIDTMGIGYTYPFVKLFFGVKIFSYTHYPLVSYDMMRDVIRNVAQFNNRKEIAESKIKSNIKKVYYVLLTYIYSFCGWIATDQIATNSSWTNNHILELWRKPEKTKIM